MTDPVLTTSFEPFFGAIYAFRTYEDPELRYVGMTTASVTVRERQHFKLAYSGTRRTPLCDWLRKHGRQAFALPIDLVTTDLDGLGAAEIEWIRRLRAEGHSLLNL